MSVVLRNGVLVGAANTNIIIGGVIVSWRNLDYSVKQKKENIMSGGTPQPVGRGRGGYEYPDAKIELLFEDYKAIVEAAPNKDPMQIALFNIPIVFDGGVLPDEVLGNCEFAETPRSIKEGDTAVWISCSIAWAGLNQ